MIDKQILMMKHFLNPVLRFSAYAFMLTFGLFSCSPDSPDPIEADARISDKCGINPQLQISFTANTSVYTKAANPQEQHLLSPAEQLLANPKFTHCDIVIGVGESGAYFSEIQLLYPDNYPYYPLGAIGHERIPEEHRLDKISTCDGTTTYYDMNGDIIHSDLIDDLEFKEDFYSSVIKNVRENAAISPEEMSILIQAMREAGLNMSTFNDNLEVLTQSFDDGSFSKVVIDKNLQTLRGQANFDAEGNVTSKSIISFTEDSSPGNLKVSSHRFTTYLPSPISGKELCITKRTSIENYTILEN